MEITKELKEKLPKAGSKEAVKSMPDTKAAAKDLETVKDDDLEGVVGGIAIRKPEEKILPVVPATPKVDKVLEGVVGGIAIRKPEEKILPVVPATPEVDK